MSFSCNIKAPLVSGASSIWRPTLPVSLSSSLKSVR